VTMWIDVSGLSDIVIANLNNIGGDDGGIGTTNHPTDSTVFVVTYQQVSTVATANRLNTLVNTNTTPIVVTALNGGTDPYSGLPLNGAAWAYQDNSPGFTVIRVVYDAGQCGGLGIAARDVLNNAITTPNSVVLYHELSHAFHFANGTFQPNGADEPPARADENVMRTQLGICLRDVNSNVITCGAGNACGGSDGGPGGSGISCFIVTASTGSPQSTEIQRLRDIRDRIAGASELAAQVIEAVYREYREFSPAIAARLEEDAATRSGVLLVVVRPLLAWYALAATLALSPKDPAAIDRAKEDLAASCRGPVGAAMIVSLLERLRDGEPLAGYLPARVHALATNIREASRLPLASWAIMEPLIRAWRSSVDTVEVVQEVALWLASVPITELTLSSRSCRLETDLKALRDLFEFSAELRAEIGRRLVERWPRAADALARNGFTREQKA